MPLHPTSLRVADVPDEVAAIRAGIRSFLDRKDAQGRTIGNAKHGIYCFYDYDGEPIYVGQTAESLRQRIGRHLTNQRTDAVAMNVLDPFEVLSVEVYPLWELADSSHAKEWRNEILDKAEYTVYQTVLRQSKFGAVLNEGDMRATEMIELPPAHCGQIIPDDVYQRRKHPDVRLARRAMTVANLARVISERDVSIGLRRTLHTQTRRLEDLARQRFLDVTSRRPELWGEELVVALDPGDDATDGEAPGEPD